MRICSVSNVVIEITRRCNMCCAHCLRGDAENIDIQERYIDAFLDSFEKGACISYIVFSGGEISLNIYNAKHGGYYVKYSANRDFVTDVTNEELNRYPEELRPQLTGKLMKVDVSEPSYKSLLQNYHHIQ